MSSRRSSELVEKRFANAMQQAFEAIGGQRQGTGTETDANDDIDNKHVGGLGGITRVAAD